MENKEQPKYPKFKYKKSDAEPKFEAVLVRSEEEEKALGAEHFDSPAEFGVVTHPNPEEELAKKAKKAEAKAKAKA